jgi:type II secretory ATPase GspE/PulE/Tfp pilus assembly ATPase PilB-like protein
LRGAQESLNIISIGDTGILGIEKEIKNISDLKDKLTSMPVTKVLNILIAGALKIGASDIHFEPEEKTIRLRYRLDGVLNDVVNFSPDGYGQLLSRIKLMSGLKINIHESPQDGRFTIREKDNDIEVRVSILPGSYGEDIVMRILDPLTIKQKLEDLGMRPDTLEIIRKLLDKTTGAILTTGPTGSGKTTTLYAFIKHINNPDIKIITIEDPVEYHIEGIAQTQVEPDAGYTFASGLRSIVRQDPDVILVGEIRDVETAEIAMQAALTGHLVFSTLHTNDAAGAIPRLIDFGVKPITIAPAINAVMAQRLVRRPCPKCGKKQKIKPEDFEIIKKAFAKNGNERLKNFNEKSEVVYPDKCAACNSTGYSGRVGVYELFEIDPELEKLIQRSPAISDVREMAVAKGMITLLQDGLLKAIEGKTTIEEVMRVIGQ